MSGGADEFGRTDRHIAEDADTSVVARGSDTSTVEGQPLDRDFAVIDRAARDSRRRLTMGDGECKRVMASFRSSSSSPR